LISDKTQTKLFWILVVITVIITALDFIALYNMKPDPNSTDPYNKGAQTSAIFMVVTFGIGILTSIVYFIAHKDKKCNDCDYSPRLKSGASQAEA
jgi:hypothetical protein